MMDDLSIVPLLCELSEFSKNGSCTTSMFDVTQGIHDKSRFAGIEGSLGLGTICPKNGK